MARILGRQGCRWLAAGSVGIMGAVAGLNYSANADGPSADWNASDVSKWLSSVGLSMYASNFRAQNVDGDILLNDLQEDMAVEDLGVRRLHAKKLMRAIQGQTGSPTPKAAYRTYPAEADLPDFSKHNNHMANVLKKKPELYAKYRNVVTPSGYTFDNAIQTGVDNPGHPFIMTVGATAGDEESYTVFKEFFDDVIAARHNGYPPSAKHPTDLRWDQLQNAMFNEKYVLTARVRTGRCIRGISLPTHCTRAERNKAEELVKAACEHAGNMDPTIKGGYEGLYEMTDERHEELIDKHLMFDKPVSPLLIASGMARDWPTGRGVYLGHKEDFIVWVNEEDHMRIVSMQKGGDMKEVFRRFCQGSNLIEEGIKKLGYEYMWNDHLGFVLTCPSNLGTGIRAGCHVKIPLVTQHPAFLTILKNMRLQKRGTGGVDTKGSGGTWDISNADRIGFSELQLVQFVVDGINLLCEMEQKLENGESIDDMIPPPMNAPW